MTSLITRNATLRARETLGAFPCLVIQGARQVGKSTFALMLMEGRPHQMVTLDNPATLAFAEEDPRAFLDQCQDGTLVIDEFQRLPELALSVKMAIDADRRPGRFILTGSSSFLDTPRTPESLAGRAIILDLYGLSQGERAGRREDFAAWIWQSGQMRGHATQCRLADYASMLATGGYPEVSSLSSRLRAQWIASYLRLVTERDVRTVKQSLSSDRVMSVLRILAANQAGELVKARVARDSRIPESTITGYLDALGAAYLTSTIPAWSANLTKREIGRPKVTISDSALAMHLSRITQEQVAAPEGGIRRGPLLEALVVSELEKQRSWSAVPFELYHFRNSSGLEVDIVMEFETGQVFLIEVKAGQTYRSDHTRAIRELAERLGSRFLGGAVLSTAPDSMVLGRSIIGLPIAAVWEEH